MKTLKNVLFTSVLFFSAAFVQAQTAGEIIAKHIEAIGGRDKLAQINSLYLERSTEMMGAASVTTTSILDGKGYRNESDFNGQQVIQVVTDKGGWAVNPFTGAATPAPLSDDAFKTAAGQVYVAGPLFNYAEKGAKAELIGKEKAGGIEAYKLRYTDKYNIETIYYIDPATYYILQEAKKANVMGQRVTVITSYTDYRKTDSGLVLPYTTNVDMGQFALKMTNTKVEINKNIDPAIFQMNK
jgi:outer membrane lipoprotein-sorting protein